MQIKTRTFFILLFIIFLLIAGSIAVWFFIKNGSTTPKSDSGTSLRDFFPFGKTSGTPIPADTSNENPLPTNTSGEKPTTKPESRLRKVWSSPVAGYTLLDKDVPVDPLAVSVSTVRTVTPTYTFTKTLSLGSTGSEVRELEKMLNACPETRVAETGIGSSGKEETTFTTKTQSALIKFQEKFPEDILKPLSRSSGTGTLDTLTRNKINKPWSCTFPETSDGFRKQATVRFVEKGNGNIYDSPVDTLKEKRLTNTTIPRIAEAFFVQNGSEVLLRYLRNDNQTIETYLGILPKETWGVGAAPGTLTGTFLDPNILDVSVSPDTQQVFFLGQLAAGVTGISGNPDGSNQKQIFDSPFTGWLSTWPNANSIFLTAKASGYAPGYLFKINPSAKVATPEKILGPIIALNTLPSPKGDIILFSRNTPSGPQLALFLSTTGVVRDLGIHTLAEKCSWDKLGLTLYCGVPIYFPENTVMPDDWYQGKLLLRDTVVKIDTQETTLPVTVADPNVDSGENIDMINLRVSNDGSYLYFINKRDDTLWQLRL